MTEIETYGQAKVIANLDGSPVTEEQQLAWQKRCEEVLNPALRLSMTESIRGHMDFAGQKHD